MTTPQFKARLLLAANQIVLSPLSGVFTLVFGVGSDPTWLTRAREESIRRSLKFNLDAYSQASQAAEPGAYDS